MYELDEILNLASGMKEIETSIDIPDWDKQYLIEVIKKRLPQKPIEKITENGRFFRCPDCNRRLKTQNSEWYKYCPRCGKALYWLAKTSKKDEQDKIS